MRVTDSMRFDVATRNLGTVQQQMLEASNVASSGVRVSKPSDDPVSAAQVARVQASLDQTSSYQTAIATTRPDLALAESSLATASDLLTHAKELALQAANGAMSSSDRSAIATELTGVRSQMLSLSNTRGLTGYIFSGSQVGTEAFDSSGNYQGDTTEHSVEIAQGVVAPVSVTGASTFKVAGGHDVFGELSNLVTALTTNNQAAIMTGVGDMEGCGKQVRDARTQTGVKLARLDSADSTHSDTAAVLQGQKSGLVNADQAAAYSRLVMVQRSLDAATTVARTTLSTLQTPLG
jgi:flagellar hook-associated protein 3 FlgL